MAIAVSGCVSQQSSLDYAGNQTSQPLPTPVGVVLGSVDTQAEPSVPEAPQTQTAALTTDTQVPATVVPQKAPRPASATQQTAELAVADPAAKQSASGNVIEQAITPTQPVAAASTNAPKVSKPETEKPATSVEVASLSPSVEAAPQIESENQQAVKKSGFFERLFKSSEKKPRPARDVRKPRVQKAKKPASRISTANAVAERPSRITRPSAQKKKPRIVVAKVRSRRDESGVALPGVKSNNEIFGIKDGPNDRTSIPNATRVAAVGSFGRLSPNGLRVQHSKVQVACLKPGVLKILKIVERRYGKKPIITSGYRSPKRNRRAGGARNSQHIFCKAVDIQVEGVSKWQLAKYLRTIPGRGGVGTYCRTKSVHIDIGSKRDWHHPCRRSAKRKKKRA